MSEKKAKTEETVVNVRSALGKLHDESDTFSSSKSDHDESASSSPSNESEHESSLSQSPQKKATKTPKSNGKKSGGNGKKVKKEESESFSEDKKSKTKKSTPTPKKKHHSIDFAPNFVAEHVGELDNDRIRKLKEGGWQPPKGKKAFKVEKEQEEQQEVIQHYLQGDFSFVETKERKEAEKSKVAIRLSFAVNIALTIIKIVVLIFSGSISIFASLLDSILDLISGSIIFIANFLQKIKEKDYYKYPVGKRRLETLSVIVFSAAMFTATGELLIRSIESMLNPDGISLSFDYVTIALVAVIIVLKFLLWLFCRTIDTPTVQALAQDHINDVFTNAVGVCCALVGYFFWSLADPLGGFFLGVFIMFNWAGTGIENVQLMTGKSADPEFLNIITQLSANHHPKIKAVDSARAYFVSNRLVVEIDLILPEDMSLKEAHDIGESLQNLIEKLPDIERAFVHLDFEDEHRHLDEHPTLKQLHAKFGTRELIPLDESNQNK